jgi:hypothetical protein
VLVCTPSLETIVDDLRSRHETPILIGEIVVGTGDVIYA